MKNTKFKFKLDALFKILGSTGEDIFPVIILHTMLRVLISNHSSLQPKGFESEIGFH